MRAQLTKLGRRQWHAQGGTSGASTARKFSNPTASVGLTNGTVPVTDSGFVLHQVSACNDEQHGLDVTTRVEVEGVSLLVCKRKHSARFTAGAGQYVLEHEDRIFVKEVLLSYRRLTGGGVSAAKDLTKSACPWYVQ